MGSYGPAFYQSYDGSGQFTYEFDGEQLLSVDLKEKEVVWRLPEFGDAVHFDVQGGLTSIAMIQKHLDVLVQRSNRTRAVSGTCSPLLTPAHPRSPPSPLLTQPACPGPQGLPLCPCSGAGEV